MMATAEHKTLRSKRGAVIESSLTDDQVIAALREGGEFARSLVAKRSRYGSWTSEQEFWAHKLALEALAPKKASEDIGGFNKIAAMFSRTAGNLKWPKIVFEFDDLTISLHVCGPRSKTPGAIAVTNGQRGDLRRWFGTIMQDGSLRRSRDCTDEIVAFLKAFAADPAAVAADYGRTSGNCCFCRRKLTDPRSTAVGYGPECAERWHLPWGHTKSPAA